MTSSLLPVRALSGAISPIVLATASFVAAATPYSIDIVIDPFHPGIRDSWFFDINNVGHAAGYIIPPAPAPYTRQAVLYRDGAYQVLTDGTVRQVNDLGAAIVDTDFESSFVSPSGVVTPINVPGDGETVYFVALRGLNNAGDVLVLYDKFTPVDAFSGLYLWNEGTATQLTVLDPLHPFLNPPNPADFTSGPSFASTTLNSTGLNDAKQFAANVHRYGYVPNDPVDLTDDVFTDDYTGAYFYDGHGGYKTLEQRTPTEEIRPIDIDEAGTVFGWTGSDLALWEPSGSLLSVLPAPAEGLLEDGYAGVPSVQRNGLGQVVAITTARGIALYEPASNAWTDVTPTVAGLPAGSTFDSIQGFNDRGQFVGLVRPPELNGTYGYVATPVPEPAGCLLALVAAAGLTVSRRGRSDLHQWIRGNGIAARSAAGALACAALVAPLHAAEYVLTASGPFQSASTQSFAFDGTTNVDSHLPSLYDTARLEGGSFVATYLFSTADPPASGGNADYNFGALQGLSFTLMDSGGVAVHEGGSSSANFASVFNDFTFVDTPRDTVNLFAFINSVTGLITPTALYQPAPDLVAIQSFLGFTGVVEGGANYLTTLALPTDSATYLSFPSRTFRTSMSFNDGDTLDFFEPYQYVESTVQYTITGVTITQVPEPSVLLLTSVAVGLAALSSRGRRASGFALAAGLALTSSSVGEAAEYRVAFTGSVVEVLDENNWFNGSIVVGEGVTGGYNFFDIGYTRGVYEPGPVYSDVLYDFGSTGALPGPVSLRYAIGANEYATDPAFTGFAIEVVNDGEGFRPDDQYRVQSNFAFPASFRDLTGDPVLDPDEIFYPGVFSFLALEDPTRSALTSSDLPLGAPDLASFPIKELKLFISDLNDGTVYAQASIRLESLTNVPEPSALGLSSLALLAGAVAASFRTRRQLVTSKREVRPVRSLRIENSC